MGPILFATYMMELLSCEKTGRTTRCPGLSGIGSGMRQARCVGNAVKDCLDSGGLTAAVACD